KNAWALLHTESSDTWADFAATLQRTGNWQGPAQHQAKDGSPRFVHETWSLQPRLDGSHASLVVAEEDQTAVKQAEDALRQLNEGLEQRVAARTDALLAAEATLRQAQKMDAVGQLASGIAHDFNNMLQGIAGSLELSRRRLDQGRLSEAARHVDSAQETAYRAATLTHRLLAFARQQPLDPKPVNLDALVAGMIEMIRRTVGSAIQVEVRLSDSTWSVLCDSSQMENALLNLCVNARDAMPGGGWLSILTEETQLSAADLAGEADLVPGAYAAVSVTDTGTGIAPEIIARVFDPFYTTKPTGKGTGLGLSQVYGFVRQSGGFVRLESASGQGTTIRLFLPRHVASDTAQADETAHDVVLLIEDQAGLRATVAEWLRDAGYSVLEAADSASALRLLQGGGRVDILVADIGLPGGLNGRQLGDEARAQRPGLPVLFTTGYANPALRTALPNNMAVIDKPFALDELTARVRTMLEAIRQ
ncbi:MAG: response regulator, partial [Rhodospirillales bacterium]|nr:response regulator [Acetobacter sp.]